MNSLEMFFLLGGILTQDWQNEECVQASIARRFNKVFATEVILYQGNGKGSVG